MKFRNLIPRLKALFLISTFALSACSGGGGGTVMPPPPPTPTPTPGPGCNSTASVARTTGYAVNGLVVRPVNRNLGGGRPLSKISIKFSGTGRELETLSALNRLGARQSAPANQQGWTVFDLPQESDAAAAAAALKGTQGILDAAPVVPRYLQDVIPNDPGFGLASQLSSGPQTTHVQWDMYKIGMPAAWGIHEGSASVVIAIIDTGYDMTNADVAANVTSSAVFDLGTGVQDTGSGVTAQDNDGHGTNVSGIADAGTNNSLRWAGVAFNVSLMEIRIFPHPTNAVPNPSASSADSAAAINYARTNGAKVISMSYGSAGSDAPESAAATAAINAGLILVGAAGNDGMSIIDFPAAYSGVISVGASAIDDCTNASSPKEYVATYSNFGSGLSVVAPGGDPTSAQQNCGVSPACDFLQWIPNNYSQTAFMNTGFTSALFAGTSQATPHVAGLAALMVSKTPASFPGNSTAASTALTLIEANTDNIPGSTHQGHGRINAANTLNHT